MQENCRVGGWWLLVAVLVACLGQAVLTASARAQATVADTRGLPRNDATPGNADFAQNAKRVALVIGNSAYKQGRLANPVNDAKAISSRLRALGFEVVYYENLKTRDIGNMYREFRSKIAPGGVALVFYAGHGLQFKGQNYFPAVDSEINFEEDVPLQSVNLGTLLDNMEEAKAAVSLVFLDACRDNPFARRFRSVSSGLAKVEAASGTLIHYATKPGSVAADGDNANGTYTEALLAQMAEPGVPVELMLKRVANRVVSKTHGKQEPWMEGSLRGDFYFIFKGPVTVQVQQQPQPQAQAAPDVDPENQTWAAASRANTLSAYQAYLNAFPQGRYAVAAKIAYESLLQQGANPGGSSGTRASTLPNPPAGTPAAAPAATPPGEDPETALWNAVETTKTADDYGTYLKQYPKGKYAAMAQQRLKKLDADAKAQAERTKKQNAEALAQADAQAWDQARDANTADAYADYLNRFPNGKFAAAAKTAQKKAQRDVKPRPAADTAKDERHEVLQRAELELWGKTESATDAATVQRYLDRYPAGAHAAQAMAKLAELTRPLTVSAPTARRGDVVGTLQVKDGFTGVTSSMADVRIVQANAERTVYSTGDIVARDGSVPQVRIGNAVLQVTSGALWTLPITANASGSAKVQLGADANLRGNIKWTATAAGGGRGQIAADVEYFSNANAANNAVNVVGKWTASYDGRHPLPESEVSKIRGGNGGLVNTEIINMSSSSMEWAEPAARSVPGGPRELSGTLLLKDAYTGVVSSSTEVRVLKATPQETSYSTGDVIASGGVVQRLRVGNVVLQVVSGALWTLPITGESSGSAKVQLGNDTAMRGTIKWSTTKLDGGKAQVNADIDYLSNANDPNRPVM